HLATSRAVRPDARGQRRTICEPLLSRRWCLDRTVLGSGTSLLGTSACRSSGGVLHVLGRSRVSRQSSRADGRIADRAFPRCGDFRQPPFVASAYDRGAHLISVHVSAIHANRPRTGRVFGGLRTELRHAVPPDDGRRLWFAVRRLALMETFPPDCARCGRRTV